ncbi:hypothetical protein CBS115989_3349 [Aspergillus niger]|nr:hypothetical protein CBS115989_3349 [Aspergillus niger]KAI2847402.1 hypothetical protein CBS11232_7118 [Aspergillus niger]KAI2853555.1 hypothetical protein CBS11350_293 [Aspergillus niger]KAI2877755.1 hypothetical protein CBS115988_3661 [Aspergillus niger]
MARPGPIIDIQSGHAAQRSLALWLAPWFNLCRTQEVISSEVKKPSSRPSSGLARLHHCRPVLGLMLV